MRNARMTILVMVAVMVICCVGAARGNTVIDDGKINNIYYTISDYIDVRHDFWGNTTTVNLLSGGSITGLYAYDNSHINVSDGAIGSILYAYDNSYVDISGGSITSDLQAYDNSQVSISGGSIMDGLNATDDSKVYISGGSIRYDIRIGVYSYDKSSLTIYGSDFAINGVSVSTGSTFYAFEDGSQRNGTLTGTLVNGDPINNDFSIVGNSQLVLIPEPTTLLLFGLGGLMLRKRK